jgi:hypothetical protein
MQTTIQSKRTAYSELGAIGLPSRPAGSVSGKSKMNSCELKTMQLLPQAKLCAYSSWAS